MPFAPQQDLSQFAVGDLEVHRIVEWEDVFITAEEMLPDATAGNLAPHRPWLEPWALCPETQRLVLPVQSYVVKSRHHVILIDSCLGAQKTIAFFEPWHKRQDQAWLARLAAIGVQPEAVDYVLCTHLHADHCGWNTQLIDGRWVPTFPNARYLFTRAEVENRAALNDPSYQQSVLPVLEVGLADLVETDYALDDQVWLQPTPGHTPGHVAVHLKSGDQDAVMIGDIMHSPVQCAEPQWHAVSDDDPEQARQTRRAMLEAHAGRPTRILTAHFPSPSVGRFVPHDGAFRFAYD